MRVLSVNHGPTVGGGIFDELAARQGHELARWIAAPLVGRGSSVADSRTRDLAVKIRGAEHGDIDTLRAQVVSLRTERAELLDVYRGFEKSQFPNPDAVAGTALHQYLVLRGGIRAEESAIDWLDEVAAGLERRDEP